MPQVICLLMKSYFPLLQRSATQHRQRENLRLLVVLVHRFDNLVGHLAGVPSCRLLLAQGAFVLVARPQPTLIPWGRRAHRWQVPDRRLVHSVPARQEHRSADLQGSHHRSRCQIGRENTCINEAKIFTTPTFRSVALSRAIVFRGERDSLLTWIRHSERANQVKKKANAQKFSLNASHSL